MALACRWVKDEDSKRSRVVLQSLEGKKFKYALKFRFQVISNQAEYEAVITGLQLAKAAGAKSLAIISDSQLVVGQVNGEYKAKEENMKKYLKCMKELVKSFQAFNISQVPREENMEADQLARLATTKEDLIQTRLHIPVGLYYSDCL
ncbi:hypothetical protein Vadar_019008 [Vaccinium darrowii]|uniref:Uncharacterized protein n=1 Tax=Vaccinium darrowii TaxID=229202 RepID=A0ACB7XRU2_9ERIC|nr:hypothetical protein Vadar_019008 [Vaccinium darrowii]